MNSMGKVILGLIAFLVLAAFPVWYTHAAGKPGYRPEPELPKNETKCVEDKAYMMASHMDLLDAWRDAVVRDGNRTYVSKAHGDRHEMSLTKNCMSCHASKEKFCDRCHNYADVNVYCWDCHVEPKGE